MLIVANDPTATDVTPPAKLEFGAGDACAVIFLGIAQNGAEFVRRPFAGPYAELAELEAS